MLPASQQRGFLDTEKQCSSNASTGYLESALEMTLFANPKNHTFETDLLKS